MIKSSSSLAFAKRSCDDITPAPSARHRQADHHHHLADQLTRGNPPNRVRAAGHQRRQIVIAERRRTMVEESRRQHLRKS